MEQKIRLSGMRAAVAGIPYDAAPFAEKSPARKWWKYGWRLAHNAIARGDTFTLPDISAGPDQ